MATASKAGARRAWGLLLPLLLLFTAPGSRGNRGGPAALLRAPPPAAEAPRSRRAAQQRPPEPIQVYGQVSPADPQPFPETPNPTRRPPHPLKNIYFEKKAIQ